MPFRYVDEDLSKELTNENLVVSVTMTQYKSDWTSRKLFWRHVERVEKSLSERQGLVGYSMRRQILGNRAWTMTIWKDESSLLAFVRSPAHLEAMQQALPTLENASFARVELPASDIPLSWEKAEQLLISQNSKSLYLD